MWSLGGCRSHHGKVTSMVPRWLCAHWGMVLAPRVKLVWDVQHWGETFGHGVIPI